jgi:hypothetical protein
MKFLRSFLLSLCMWCPLAASAQNSNQMVETREFLAWCAAGTDSGTAACTAFIMGVADAVAAPSAASCPGTATRSLIREAVIRDIMGRQPIALMDLPAVVAVTSALQAAYPCRG